MARKDKREQRIRANPTNVSLGDFENLVKQYGRIIQGAKHPLAAIGERVFPYRHTNPVRTPYVKRVLEIIDKLNKEKYDGEKK